MAQRIVNNRKKLKNEIPIMESKFDAQGSYTGTDFYDKEDKPVQDADDL